MSMLLPLELEEELLELDEELLELDEEELLELDEEELLELDDESVPGPAPQPSIVMTGAATAAEPNTFIKRRREASGAFSSGFSIVLVIMVRAFDFL